MDDFFSLMKACSAPVAEVCARLVGSAAVSAGDRSKRRWLWGGLWVVGLLDAGLGIG
jgi:hypothetical protein